MNGVRFYLEFPTDRAKHISGRDNIGHAGNVFAAFVCNGRAHDGGYEGLGAVYDTPNSEVAGTSSSDVWLRYRAKRIPEKLARVIHPALFVRLEEDNERDKEVPNVA